MTVLDNDDFADIEARLRRDLAPLADAILNRPAVTTTDLAPAVQIGESAIRPGQPRRTRRWLAAAAAVLLAVGAAAAIWQIADGENRIETEPVVPAPDETEGEVQSAQWIELPPAPDGVRSRGHMVSVWTGDEALFWGGRSDGATPEAFVGGVAYNPTTDSWREIEAPEWAHPGADGVYLEGWVYLAVKGGVTRFDPDTGAEEEIALDPRFGSLLTVATDGAEVFAFGQASGGLGFQVVGPTPGELQVFEGSAEITEALNNELVAAGGQMSVLGWRRNNFVMVLPDGISYGFTLEDGPAVTGIVYPPAGLGDYRVELANTSNGPLVIHLRGDGGVDIHNPADGTEWGFAVAPNGFDGATVVGAGEWVVLLRPGLGPLLSAPPDQGTGPASTVVPVEWPAEILNPNAVWTGTELIVWGGNSTSGPDAPTVGGRITVPAAALYREREPDTEGESAQDAAEDSPGNSTGDSVGDETEFRMLEQLVSELPDEQRIPAGPYDDDGNERFDYQWTAEGLWVYSRPEPAEPGAVMGAGEILLLEDWGGPIIDSWLLGYFPGEYAGQIEVADEAVYCMYIGDGGLPDSQFCRIDRNTGELSVVIHLSEIDGGDDEFYTDMYADSGIDWRIVPAESPAAVRPFGWLYIEEASVSDGSESVKATPAIVNESRLVRLDPETFDSLEVVDLAATGQRIFPCPSRSENIAQIVDDDLPPAVSETRQAIMEAAAACDVDALVDLSGGQLTMPSKDGGRGMKDLAGLLTLSPDAVQGGDNEGGQTVYLFPSASVGLSRPLIDTISRFYGPDSDDHLTIILEDGTWLPVSP